jgi:hypothetical protein
MLVQLYAIAPVASAAQNHQLIPVSGSVTISPGIPLWSHTSGNLIHIFAMQNAIFSGSFVGNVVTYWFITENLVTGEMKMVGGGTFTGTMEGKSGTFTFTTVGWGSDPTFHNEWNIVKGTGDFSHIHGKGTLDGDLYTLTGSYSGSIFFSQ